MHLFINERSFRGQFHAREDLLRAVTRFLRLVDSARRALDRRGGRMWRSQHLADSRALRDESLRQSLNHIAGREPYGHFQMILFDMANPAPWEPERVHQSDELYFWHEDQVDVTSADGECVTDTSMAELAARILRDGTLCGSLLNIGGSLFDGKRCVNVLNEKQECALLPCSCTEMELDGWLRDNVFQVPDYTPDATEPPQDDQTCLGDRTLYEPTGREFQGRKIYRHRTNRQLYYVDNLHFGAEAHLEVFDKRGLRHVGKASLQGQIRPSTRDPQKRPLDM